MLMVEKQQKKKIDEDAVNPPSTAVSDDQSGKTNPSGNVVIIAGSAMYAARRRRFINNRSVSELVWIDLTEDVGVVEEEEEEEAMEQSYDDLCDHFIEFREDNINNSSAASLKYSLPIKFQSDVLRQQIEEFRAYRRQRFSLFRKGPLVEETTISSNISSLIRFLGYLFYEHKSTLQEQDAPLDMSVFALPNINYLVLNYVEWLEQRRGCKRQAPTENGAFQSVSPATVANYLNGLVSIVKYQLQHDIYLRDSLLDQLRNLRSQAESYSMTQKKFEKVHPEWCSWQELQVAREKCRAAFDQAEYNTNNNISISSLLLDVKLIYYIFEKSVYYLYLPSVHLLVAPLFVSWNGTRHW